MSEQPPQVTVLDPASMLGILSLYDFDWQPTHPEDWYPVLSRDLMGASDMFELSDWLWVMTQGRWHVHTHYTPALRQLVYFQNGQDAMAFKLAWGATRGRS